jgi:hypothetical protein
MLRFTMWSCGAVALFLGMAALPVMAEHRDATLAVTMTNDPSANAIEVYDALTHVRLQTLPTRGKGGVAGNARGIKQHDGELLAVVNNGSSDVSLFRRQNNGFRFERLIPTTSAPVSIDFGNDHMYVAGATTVDSFPLFDHHVGNLDGTTTLQLVTGVIPQPGSTAQVGALDQRHLLVTLKTDPDPGTVDVVALDRDGSVAGAVTAVSAPDGTLTPFGFSVYPDGSAIVTLAHTSQDGLFRDGAFAAVIDAGQAAPCWTTRVGKYVFTANTGSKTISRLIGTGGHVFVDAAMAAKVTAGGSPSDIDADRGVLGVLDKAAGAAHLSLFTYNTFGELTPSGPAIALGAAGANGVAIVGPQN